MKFSLAHEMMEERYFCKRTALLMLFSDRGLSAFTQLINLQFNEVFCNI